MVLTKSSKEEAEGRRIELKKSLDFIKDQSKKILERDKEIVRFVNNLVIHSKEDDDLKKNIKSTDYRSWIDVIGELIELIEEFDPIIRESDNFLKFLQDVGFRGWTESEIIRNLKGCINILKEGLNKLTDGRKKYIGIGDPKLLDTEIDVVLKQIRRTEMLIDIISNPVKYEV